MQRRRVLVTGATGGIGRRLSKRLCEEGTNLVLMGRSLEKLNALRGELIKLAQQNEIVIAAIDFSNNNYEENVLAISNVVENLDGVVIIYPSVPKSDEIIPSKNVWDIAISTCFVNPLILLRSCLDKMRMDARIVVVSGIASMQVFPELACSNVIRKAWIAETKLLSFRLSGKRIRTNTVSLGGTLTENFVSKLSSRHLSSEKLDNIPLGKYCDPDDAVFIISSLLSRLGNHINGANIVCDGGYSRTY